MAPPRRPASRLTDHLVVAAGATVAFGLGAGVATAALLLSSDKNGNIRFPWTRPPPLAGEEWEEAQDSDRRVCGFNHVLRRVQEAGMDNSLRKEVWPYLLGLYRWDSTEGERRADRSGLTESYRALRAHCRELSQELGGAGAGGGGETSDGAQVSDEALSFQEWRRVILMDAVRADLPAIPRTDEDSEPDQVETASEGDGDWDLVERPVESAMEPSVPSRPDLDAEGIPQLPGEEHLSEWRRYMARRLVCILEAYAVHDRETGYCQGMTDILCPLVVLLEDDAEAFWCFERLMRRARRNFMLSEVGIRGQLAGISGLLERHDPSLWRQLEQVGASECLFAYRMVLVLLRRDLPFNQLLSLWEVAWAEALLGGGEGGGGGTAPPPGAQAAPIEAGGEGPGVGGGGGKGGEVGGGGPGDDHRHPSDLLLCFVAAFIRARSSAIIKGCSDLDEVLQLFATAPASAGGPPPVDLWGLIQVARSMQ